MEEYDVLIAGGGPAGAAAASILAEGGKRVLILEKETFPRYHIGESLIPYNYFPLKRMGMIPKLRESSFIKKFSVQFVGECGTVSKPFYFDRHKDHPSSQTWQVERAQFDEMLVNHACEQGAQARFGVDCQRLLVENDRVVGVETNQGTFRAPVTIDATGRRALGVAQFGWRVPDKDLRKIALWTYYKGAQRDEGRDEGATTVAYVGGKNWFWYIPMQNDIVSVGLVGGKDYLYRDTRDPQEIFDREIKNNQWVADHLAGSTQHGPVDVTADFSYRSRFCAMDGLVLAGDAFAFLDPCFSSGVFFALYQGVQAAEAILASGPSGGRHAADFTDYGEDACRVIENMRQLVYAFYTDGFNFGKLLKKYPEVRPALTDCLIGATDKDFSELFMRINEFMELPDSLEHGRTMIPEFAATA